MTPQPPPRPPAWLQPITVGLFFLMGPRLPRVTQPDPPDELRPWEKVSVERNGAGPLSGTWYPAPSGSERGAVLLLHPWVEWGKSYFHRRGRIEALRAAGYHVLTVDLGGFGGARRRGYLDHDVEAGLDYLRSRSGALPIHIWGVSAGGYWSHVVLSRQSGVAGAMFEDVSPHLIEWSWRMAPWGRPAFLFYRNILRAPYRFLDIRRHARAMSLAAVSYVSGERDRGVRPEDTQALATAAGGRALIVPGADHLGSIKVANEEVIALALDTFRRAEELTTS